MFASPKTSSILHVESVSAKEIYGFFSSFSVSLLELVYSGLTFHQQGGHTETGPRFKVSSERLEKRGINLATQDW